MNYINRFANWFRPESIKCPICKVNFYLDEQIDITSIKEVGACYHCYNIIKGQEVEDGKHPDE
jgi:hypothetical protein